MEFRKYVLDNRIVLMAIGSLCWNLSYAIYNGVLGILGHSLWFLNMFAYCSVLAIARAAILLAMRTKDRDKDLEIFIMRFSGWLLIVLDFFLALVIYVSIKDDISRKYGEIMMITIAFYTFTKIGMSIRKAIKRHNDKYSLFMVLRAISYSEAAVSIATLQRSMLVSFAGMEKESIQLMNILTGLGVFLFIFILAIFLIVRSRKWQNQD